MASSITKAERSVHHAVMRVREFADAGSAHGLRTFDQGWAGSTRWTPERRACGVGANFAVPFCGLASPPGRDVSAALARVGARLRGLLRARRFRHGGARTHLAPRPFRSASPPTALARTSAPF